MDRRTNRRPDVSSLALLLAAALPAVLPLAAAAQLWDARDRFFVGPDLGDPAFQRFGTALASCDFNNDGRDDLAVGAPSYATSDGAVTFYLGTPSGALTLSSSVTGSIGSRYGEALACGSFRGDGTVQVAVGAPEHVQDGIEEGKVEVYGWNGSEMALVIELRQSLPGVSGAAENGDEFGAALASGDFDDDGVGDLAIGSPGEAVGSLDDAGAVTTFYGVFQGGLAVAGNQIWHKDVTGAGGDPAAGERAGEALTAFDGNCDTFDDLAIGIPGQTVSGQAASGNVYLLAGAETGILPTEFGTIDVTHFTQEGANTPTAGDRFGAALAPLGLYFGQSCAALAIGAPGREVDSEDEAGAIYLTRFAQGTTRYFTRQDLGLFVAAGDRFGASLAAADWNADGRNDLAIGVPGNDPILSSLHGGIYVMLSQSNEPLPENARLIQPRSTLEMSDVIVDDGALGVSLAVGDFDGNGVPDLAAGTPTADTVEDSDTGGVEVLFGALFAADFEGGDDNEFDLP